MTQLVELQKNLAEFEELGIQVVGLLRNEALGAKGLKLAKENTKASFPLAYDVKAKATPKYGPKFTMYLIDEKGVVRAVLPKQDKKPVKPSVIIAAFQKLTNADSPGANGAGKPVLIARPDAFKTLVNPPCSYCVTEAKRRAGELKPNEPVLAWTRSNHEGGAIQYRFFLEPYRVISDTYGVFVYDPDAGFARGFKRSLEFTFHGWRNGIMVMKHKDGTLFSTLSGRAFAGPRKGEQLKVIPTITTNWGYWNAAYPKSVNYRMFEKYQPIELTKNDNADSVRSRGPADKRFAKQTAVLGVNYAGKTKAYPIAELEKSDGLIKDSVGGKPIMVLWYAPTRTAAVYTPDVGGYKGKKPTQKVVTLIVDKENESAPFVDRETKSRWGIEGRAQSGPLKGKTLRWVDSVQCRWFAWAAEYPDTELYSRDETAKSDRANE